MPRELKDEKEPQVKEQPQAEQLAGEFKFLGKLIKSWDMNKESLPACEKGKKGKLGKPGEPRYFMRKAHGKYLLIKAMRKQNGICHRLVKALKDSPKFPANRALIQKLLKAGFKVQN